MFIYMCVCVVVCVYMHNINDVMYGMSFLESDNNNNICLEEYTRRVSYTLFLPNGNKRITNKHMCGFRSICIYMYMCVCCIFCVCIE